MNERRLAGLRSLERTSGVEVVLIQEADIEDHLVAGHPLHPAFPYLSAVHQADHLRTYVMHFHGGGYSDIKAATGSWTAAFDRLAYSGLVGAGYPEIGRHGVAVLGVDTSKGRYQPLDLRWWHYRWLQVRHRLLLGNCAYIFRPRMAFTQRWYEEQWRRLDALLPALERNPARYPLERGGHVYDGEVSDYPVPWSHLLGDVFQPLTYRFRRRLGRFLPSPDFSQPYE
jgi:hypothetical protein